MTEETFKPAVLLVDDDPQILETAAEILEERYAVTTAATLSEALARVKERLFSAVVADFTLPDGKGMALAEALEKSRAVTPVIFMTGMSGLDLKAEKRASNVHACLLKPVSPDTLHKTIEDALNSLRDA